MRDIIFKNKIVITITEDRRDGLSMITTTNLVREGARFTNIGRSNWRYVTRVVTAKSHVFIGASELLKDL